MSRLLETVPPRVGDVLAGKYRLVRLVGEGGMGIVFEALQLNLGQHVAIKVLATAERNAERSARFAREARAAAKLSSPHVVRVYDILETDEGLPFLVMEMLSGWDLERELEERGPLPIGEAIDYALQTCKALEEAHAHGIVHRDLKPSNLFLVDGAKTRTLKLLDFGISKWLDDDLATLTASGTWLGTPYYMAPEQTLSARNADARSDVWSLGVILYRMLVGALPFPGPTPPAAIVQIATETPIALAIARPETPRALCAVVERMLAKKPEERFASVTELAAALEAARPMPMTTGDSAAAARLSGAPAPSSLSAAPPPPTRHKLTPLLAIGAFAIALLTFAALHRTLAPRSPEPIASNAPTPTLTPSSASSSALAPSSASSSQLALKVLVPSAALASGLPTARPEAGAAPPHAAAVSTAVKRIQGASKPHPAPPPPPEPAKDELDPFAAKPSHL